ncbi:MAG TPA: lytic transglycosylase domain-containing protein, partial [Gemmatimonadota bacterium]|nr:lytic transglycosylase domain-containing protein [Gemmatimonadota bacterium]
MDAGGGVALAALPSDTFPPDTLAADTLPAAALAVDTLPVDSVRALVRRAADLAKAGQHAAAGGLYEAAARGRPEVADWLRLSALQEAGRAGLPGWAAILAAGLGGSSAVPADSVALEQVRAALLAADSADASGLATLANGMDPDWDPALWTRRAGPALLAAGDTASALAGYRRVLDAAGVPAEAGDVLLGLDGGWRSLREVAFSDRREGRPERAARLLARAERRAPPDRRPHLALEAARTRLAGGLPGVREAVADWTGRASTPDSVRAAMELAVGTWALRHGRAAEAGRAFRRAAGGSGTAAARASYLVADLAHDRHRLDTMRTWLERTANRFRSSGYGHLALMRLGFLAYLQGDYGTASGRFSAYRHGSPGGDWARAALYWEARAREAGDDSARGRELLEKLARADPAGYYGLRALDRLDRADSAVAGVPAPAAAVGSAGLAAGADGEPEDTTWAGRLDPGWEARVDALLRRMDLLRELAWRDRALAELGAVRRELSGSPGRTLRLARRLEDHGWSGPAIGMAWAVFARRGGVWTPSLLRAVYPLPYRDQILSTADGLGLDPAFLAGVIRQESAFDPTVVSTAGAVGLTQLLPSTARRVARRSGLPVPDSSDLFEPPVNLILGARYLAGLLDRYGGSRLATLVAYNAGPERWRRWQRLPESGADPELFIEAIPFAETRRYVKAVFRNELLYRRLHDLPRTGGAAAAAA